jgi:hypothetical protein
LRDVVWRRRAGGVRFADAPFDCLEGWELTGVEQGWFYAEGEGSVGPVSFDALTDALLRMPEPGQTSVWRAGFENWRPARDVPELAGLVSKQAPAVAVPDPSIDRWTADETAAESSWGDDGLPEIARRRWPYMAAAAVVAAMVVAGIVYAMRDVPVSVAPEARVVLPAASPPEQSGKEIAREDPAIALAQLSEKAAQAAAATDALAQQLWASIEPPTMQAPDYATASRDELENYLRDLRTAETNLVDAHSQYVVLLKAERELIEESVLSSGLEEGRRSELLRQVDDRQGAALELANRMLQARADLYRAMQAMQAAVIEQFGKYRAGPGGQIRFSDKAATDRFAAAAEEVNAANKRLDLIEDRMLKERQAPQPGWKDMVIK